MFDVLCSTLSQAYIPAGRGFVYVPGATGGGGGWGGALGHLAVLVAFGWAVWSGCLTRVMDKAPDGLSFLIGMLASLLLPLSLMIIAVVCLATLPRAVGIPVAVVVVCLMVAGGFIMRSGEK